VPKEHFPYEATFFILTFVRVAKKVEILQFITWHEYFCSHLFPFLKHFFSLTRFVIVTWTTHFHWYVEFTDYGGSCLRVFCST